MRPITKAEARAFRRRWKAINNAELEELRATPISQKLHQLAALMLSARQLGWTKAFQEEEAEVRERWTRLRKAFHG